MYEYYNHNNDFLAHYGVKGMKWGVRHEKKRDIKRTKKKLMSMKEYEKQSEIYKSKNPSKQQGKIRELQKQANELARKYDFDQDDGGGGSTLESQKAGQKYMAIWNDIEQLQRNNDRVYTGEMHKQFVNEQLIKKYGEKTLNEVYKNKNWRVK